MFIKTRDKFLYTACSFFILKNIAVSYRWIWNSRILPGISVLLIIFSFISCAMREPPAGAVPIELVRNKNFTLHPLYQFDGSGNLSPGESKTYFIKIPSGIKTIIHARVTGEKKDEIFLDHKGSLKTTGCTVVIEENVNSCSLDLRLPGEGLHLFVVKNGTQNQKSYTFYMGLKSDKPMPVK
jgi:hypothetical protein